jgi:1-Cys peroxiredoxin 6
MFSLRLGETAPDFDCETTKGNFSLHEFIKKDAAELPWTVLLSHPSDFTPVCTTELGRAEALSGEFRSRGVKLIGISCDSVESHEEWSKDILHRENVAKQCLSFPIIADPSKTIVTNLGMLDPRTASPERSPLPARALIIFDQECKVRLAILYPASTGRNFNEILRALDSLNITQKFGVATPVDWKPDEKVIVPPGVPSSKFKNVETEALPSGKEYLRFTKL